MLNHTVKKIIVPLVMLGIIAGIYIHVLRQPHSQIITVSSMAQVREFLFSGPLKKAPNDTLVIFDLDNTLIAPVDAVASDQWFDASLHFYQARGLTCEQATTCLLPLWMDLFHKAKMQPVEPEAVPVLTALMERQIPVIALTSRQMKLSALTTQQLHKTNLAFTNSPLTKNAFIFDESSRTKFEDGVLFCSGKDKGLTLAQFLDQLKIQPHTIVCIDDKEKHLQSVAKVAAQQGCHFIGLRYSFLDEKVKNYALDNNSIALLEHNAQLPFCALPQCA